MSGSRTPLLLINISSSEDENDVQAYSTLKSEEPREVHRITTPLHASPTYNSAEQRKTEEKPSFSNLLLSSLNLLPVNDKVELLNNEMTITVTPLSPVESLPCHTNGAIKQSEDVPSPSSSRHISPLFLGSSSSSTSRSEPENIQIAGSTLPDVKPFAKRKSSFSISQPLQKKQKFMSEQTSFAEDFIHQTFKPFHTVNGATGHKHVESPAHDESEWRETMTNSESSLDDSLGKKAVANFVDVLRITCSRVLNKMTNEYVNDIEKSVEKCSVPFLGSLKCRELIETNTKQISNHLKNMEACVTEVIHELQSQSTLNYHHENNSTNNSVSQQSSVIVEAVTSSSRPLSSVYSDQEENAAGSAENAGGIVDEETRKNMKKIKKLEGLLKKLDRKIQFYREREIVSDEEEDSAYIRQDRLERKAMAISKMLWELNGEKLSTGRPIQKKISYHGTRYPQLNDGIQYLINKKKIFPDFKDILDVVQLANEEHSLGIGDTSALAQTIFKEVAYEIKERRIRDHEMHFDELLDESQQDPAEDNVEWQQQLKDNHAQAQQRIQEVIDRFASIPENPSNENSGSENEKSEGEDDDDDDKKSENGDTFMEEESIYMSDSDGGHDNEDE